MAKMWEGFGTLLIYCVVIGVSSFLVGLLPISVSLSQNNSRLITALGSGLLVGACLIVIIPEGVEQTYSAAIHFYENRNQGSYNYPGILYEPHGYIGVSLVLGFILMFLIDNLPKHMSQLSQRKRYTHVPLSDLSQGARPRSPDGIAGPPARRSPVSPAAAATIGLVIHSIADGIALASSTFISHQRTGLIVFFALMIHKAPAAFGLTSVLLKKGLGKGQARFHLLCFSLAAPLGAIATWLFVKLLIGSNLGQERTRFATGLLLIFSGGTFLYVAMHAAGDDHGHEDHDTGNGYAEVEHSGEQNRRADADAPKFRETVITVAGMLLPLLAELGGHAH